MRLSRPFGPAAAGLAGVVSALAVTGPELMATAWKTALALTLWSLGLLNRSGSRSAFVAGLLAGLEHLLQVRGGRPARRCAPAGLAGPPAGGELRRGGLPGVVPTLVHLVVAGRAVFDNVVLQRLGLDGQLDRSQLPGPTVAGLLVVLASAAVLVGFAAVRRDRHLVSLALLAVLMLPQALQRIDIFHVTVVGCVVTALAAAVVAGDCGTGSVRWPRSGPGWWPAPPSC